MLLQGLLMVDIAYQVVASPSIGADWLLLQLDLRSSSSYYPKVKFFNIVAFRLKKCDKKP